MTTKSLQSAVVSLFPSRVSEVTMRDGAVVTITKKQNSGSVLLAMRDAIVNGTDMYNLAGRLLDLQKSGEFTVKESKVVDSILDHIDGLAKSGVTFTAGRVDLSAGQEYARGLRARAKSAK
jgi:hypothetical protein